MISHDVDISDGDDDPMDDRKFNQMSPVAHVCGDRYLPCFDIYKELAMKTKANYGREMRSEQLVNAALGLAGEAGEFADLVKKWRHHGHQLDSEKMEEELGDVLWYVAEACDALFLEMGMVARKNIMKLAERYPEGFDSKRSINR